MDILATMQKLTIVKKMLLEAACCTSQKILHEKYCEAV